MQAKDVIKQLKLITHIYAYIRYNDDNGAYIRIMKTDFIDMIRQFDPSVQIDISINPDNKTAYIG